ncbi:hypothetical protein [Mycobacteroides abscessus]|uniref:hypothetical protein n=1 Tax=Mycobacteroides abscessus TaxID=36809 RepID=UPI0010423154|nr:hypothetical protein [Mycobacteroides abscessus]
MSELEAAVQRLHDLILTFLRETSTEAMTADEIAEQALPPIRVIERGEYVIEEPATGSSVEPHLRALQVKGKVRGVNGRWEYVCDARTARIVAGLEASLKQPARGA